MQKSQNSCTIVTVKAIFQLRTISNKAHPLKILRLKKPLKDYSSRGISSDSKGNRTPKKTLKPA